MMKNTNLNLAAAILAGVLGFSCAVTAGAQVVRAGTDTTSETSHARSGKFGTAQDTEYAYCVGSVSKVYVTAAAMKLADEGKLGLDDSICDLLPEFAMADERYRDITVRMLMDHTSGIMGTSQIGVFLYDDNTPYHHDHLLETLFTQRLKADPGDYAAYCNDGFDLLEQIVERVSGMSYTEYVKKELAAPTGGTRTGSGLDHADSDELAPAYGPGNLLYDNGITMCTGAGGVYSVASDVSRFGSAFFAGSDALLTQASKERMATRWTDDTDDCLDRNGLGWDDVSMERYEKNGVRVLGKGGDAMLNHAFLMVAPEEEISISILSNGGSSTYNAMMAEALLDVVLGERGIVASDGETGITPVTEVPASYDRYAGTYAVQNALAGGAGICRISFPDHKYMHTESISPSHTSVTDYIYTAEGKFAELAYEVEDIERDATVALHPDILTFAEDEAGHVTIACDTSVVAPGLGSDKRHTYIGEKMEENPTDQESIRAFVGLCGSDFLLYNDIPSSGQYETGIVRLSPCEEMPGYVFLMTGQGTRLLKITDPYHAIAFQSIPSSTNRDLVDVELRQETDGVRLIASNGSSYKCADAIPVFDSSADAVTITGDAAVWYRIGDDLAGSSVPLTGRPDKGVIYVFNKYGEVVYTTHVRDADGELPMPRGGRIVFLGEAGSTFRLN